MPASSDHGDAPREIVEFGSSTNRGRRWFWWLGLGCLAIAVLVAETHHAGRRHATPPPAPPPVRVIRLGHSLLGVTGDWRLVGLTPDGLVSIELSRGAITSTALPPPEGSGPISLIVSGRTAIIRPLENVPGYLVPDGAAARRLTGVLAGGSLLLPGPTAADEWLVSGDGSSIPLVGPDGRPTGVRITLPAHWAVQSAMPDGHGGVLVFNNTGRQYDAGPGLIRPVGALLVAIGPTRWLGLACEHRHCVDEVIDIATGARRSLPGPAVQPLSWPWPWQPGVVSPDGSTAAVIIASATGRAGLDLVNLTSGAIEPVSVALPQDASSQNLAWSPDSRWLFVAGAGGKVYAVGPRSRQVAGLGVSLPAVSQLAVQA